MSDETRRGPSTHASVVRRRCGLGPLRWSSAAGYFGAMGATATPS